VKQQYAPEARTKLSGEPIAGDVQLEIALYFGTKRKTDWDNYHKLRRSLRSVSSVLRRCANAYYSLCSACLCA